MAPTVPDFEPGLPVARVDEKLRHALSVCDHAQASVVLWLAEVLRRGLCRQLGHPSPRQYATEALGMSRSRAYDLLQLARDLDRLPRLRGSIAAGRMGWTKARLVARVATAASESRWVAAAENLGRRELVAHIDRERDAARRRREARSHRRATQQAGQTSLVIPFHPGGPRAPASELEANPGIAATNPEARRCTPDSPATETDGLRPAQPARSTVVAGQSGRVAAEPPVTVSFRLSSLDHARFEALAEQVRRRRRVPPRASREEMLLVAMSRLAIGAAAAGDGDGDAGAAGMVESSRLDVAVRCQIVVYRCKECDTARVVTGQGHRRLSRAEAETVACDARVLERGKPNRATIPPRVRAAVMARDGHRCQAPGCGNTHFLEVHHRVARADGGSNRPENLVTLCSRCHRFAHERPDLVRRWIAESEKEADIARGSVN